MAGMLPWMAHSPMEIRILQCLRKLRITSRFSSLETPPSMMPTSTGPVNSLMSSIGDLSNSTSSIRSSRRSSMSRMDMGPPKQEVMAVGPPFPFPMLFPPSRDIRADGLLVVLACAHRHLPTHPLHHQAAGGTIAGSLVRGGEVGVGQLPPRVDRQAHADAPDRKSTRLNSSHGY